MTQGPSPEMGQLSLQEETKIPNSEFPNSEFLSPPGPDGTLTIVPKPAPLSDPHLWVLLTRDLDVILYTLTPTNHPILPITLSGVLPSKHYWGPFQGSWRILSLPSFMDPSTAPRPLRMESLIHHL